MLVLLAAASLGLCTGVTAGRKAKRSKAAGVAELYNTGTELLGRGAAAEALASFDEAVRLNPSGATPHLLVNRALTLARMGRKLDALSGYDQALRTAPSHPYALYNRCASPHGASCPICVPGCAMSLAYPVCAEAWS